jgi:hypothetical protein
MNNFTCNATQKTNITKQLADLIKLKTKIQASTELSTSKKAEIISKIDALNTKATSLFGCCVASANGRPNCEFSHSGASVSLAAKSGNDKG